MDDSLEEKHQRMLQSEAAVNSTIESYSTPEGTIFKLPDFSDPVVFKLHMDLMRDAQAYFTAAKHLKHATTYRFKHQQNRILYEQSESKSDNGESIC